MTTDRAFWTGRKVLVTGHTGFKGAWLVAVLLDLGADVTGVALPPLPGGIFERTNLAERIDSRHVDIRDLAALTKAVGEVAPETVFHLAAQALVPASYGDPVATYDVNVMGTVHLLDAVTRCPSVRQALVVTSDKVYANDGRGKAFTEGDALGGEDPYSSSKAACELVTHGWRSTVRPERDLTIATARAGNVIGGGDVAPGRLLPDLFRALEGDGRLLLRSPASVRPWQFVLEPVSGYIAYLERLARDAAQAPPALNFGPDPGSVRTVAEVAESAFRLLGEGGWEPTHDRAGPEAATLAIDSSLARATLGWQPRLDLDTAIEWTCDWFRTARGAGDCAALCAQQIGRYSALMPT